MAGGVGQPLPNVVLGDFALAVAVEHVDGADPFQRYRGELADGDVHDGAAEARGDGAEDGAGRLGGHVDHVAVDGIVQPGHQQAFGLGFGELVIRVLPDVVHAAGGQAHQEAAIFAAADAGAYQVVEREGGIECHVGFILVLAFTITVPSGPYYAVAGILDQNDNGGFGAGSITNLRNKVPANLTISGSTQTVAGITLPTSNSTATVATQFSSNTCLTCGSPSTSYQLTFTVSGSDKQPVAVTLNSGPNVLNNNGTVALDMGICIDCGNPQFGYSVSLAGAPNVGDTYGFTVTYSDGSM